MKILLLHNNTDLTAAQPGDNYGRTSCAPYVEQAMNELGHDVIPMLADYGMLETLPRMRHEIDLLFNLADEGYCCRPDREAHIPAFLEMLGIPYTGSSLNTLVTCLDKATTNAVLRGQNIHIPESRIIDQGKTYKPKSITTPYFVKPNTQDGSIGISNHNVVRTQEQLDTIIKHIHTEYQCEALVQEFIDGDEYNVGIIGRSSPEVLAISRLNYTELPIGHEKILTYNSKWDDRSVEYNKIGVDFPNDIPPELKDRLILSAMTAYKRMGIQDYGRIDFRVLTTSGSKGIPYIIDVNPNPDISPDAGLANMARSRGWEYKDLIARIISSSLEQKRR